MAKSGLKPRTLGALAGIVVLAAAGGAAFYYYSHRDLMPALAVPEIQNESRQAAQLIRSQGQVLFRAATAADEAPDALPLPLPSPMAGQLPAGWERLDSGAVLRLGTLLRAEAASRLELTTTGNWYMALDGIGALILQDARRNAEGTEHTLSVYVQKGTFRAKSAAGTSKGFFIEVTTAAARGLVYEGEIGMEVGAGRHGRMWLASGKAVAVWKDGRRKELGLLGLEEL